LPFFLVLSSWFGQSLPSILSQPDLSAPDHIDDRDAVNSFFDSSTCSVLLSPPSPPSFPLGDAFLTPWCETPPLLSVPFTHLDLLNCFPVLPALYALPSPERSDLVAPLLPWSGSSYILPPFPPLELSKKTFPGIFSATVFFLAQSLRTFPFSL